MQARHLPKSSQNQIIPYVVVLQMNHSSNEPICLMTGARTSFGHGFSTSALKHHSAFETVVSFLYLCRVGPLYRHHAHPTNCCPENGPHTPAQCQCQSCSAGHPEDLGNQHISAFISSEVARVESAGKVDHFGQRFDYESPAYGDPHSHEPQNDVDLQYRQNVPQQVEDQCRAKRTRRLVAKA